MRRLNVVQVVLLMLPLLLSANTNADWTDGDTPRPVPHRKLIEYGWDVPTAEFVRQNIQEMETRPFDGVIFKIEEEFHRAFDTRYWNPQDMNLHILEQIEWGTFTDNFLILWATNDYGMDWFNNSHWRVITHNMRLYARAARTAGCVGIAFDPEHYSDLPSPWEYNPQRYSGYSFADVEAMVRQRGYQFISAIQQEFPDARILSLFMLSSVAHHAPEDLQHARYALLPSFLEGMLEGSENVTIVDGNESAYYYDQTGEFFDGSAWIREGALAYVSPVYQAAYSDRVQVGMALYMDRLLGESPDKFQRQRWLHHVYHALATTDEYVWVYSEEMDWWRGEVFPGGEEGLRTAEELYFQGLPLGFSILADLESTGRGMVVTIPTVNITGPPHQGTAHAPADVTISATASSGTTSIEFYINAQHAETVLTALQTWSVSATIRVNIRSCPSTDCAVISGANPGETLQVMATENNWHAILMPDNSTAYIAAWLTSPAGGTDTDSDEVSASYTWTELPPGDYAFLARAFDSEGNQGTSGSLFLRVLP